VARRGENFAKRTIKSGLEAQPRSRPGKHKKEEEDRKRRSRMTKAEGDAGEDCRKRSGGPRPRPG
jgi:hypothetical protein